jgi:uncharacterized lipoprotein
MLRCMVLACLVLGLAGCGIGKKDKANNSKSGTGGEQSSPTYEWERPPEDAPRPAQPPAKPGERKPF